MSGMRYTLKYLFANADRRPDPQRAMQKPQICVYCMNKPEILKCELILIKYIIYIISEWVQCITYHNFTLSLTYNMWIM